MKRLIKRTIVGSLFLAFIGISGLVALIFYPQSLFANKFEYHSFEVFYDQHYILEEEAFQDILDNAYLLVERSELHNPNFVFRIFLAHNNVFNRIESLQGGDVIARATAWNIICKVELDIQNNKIYSHGSTANLTEVLAHEMVHILQADKYGLYSFSPLKHPPMWKLEGYPEYIARHNRLQAEEYDLVKEIQRFIAADEDSKRAVFEAVEGHFMPSYYFKGRIMIEYLMDIKRMSYDEILEDQQTEEEIFGEMLEWVNAME